MDSGSPVVASLRPRILVVSPYSLHPMIHGGAVRIRNLNRRLAAHCDVYALLLIGGNDDPEQRRALSSEFRRVFFQLVGTPPTDRPPGELPPEVEPFATPCVADRVRSLVAAYDIDLVQLEYAELGFLHGPYANAKVVLTEHDVAFRSHQRRRALGIQQRYGGDARPDDDGRWYRYETSVCGRVDQIHVMSEDDGAFMAPHLRDGAARLRVVPNGVDTEHYRPPPEGAERRDVLFAGSFPHLPNRDALDFFVESVWPLVRRRDPEIGLTVAGAQPPEDVLRLDGRDRIRVVGEVPSLLPLYQGHRLLAAPIRAGSGTRLKILEALASGLPVVSTTLGAEGLRCRDGEHLLIADSPEAMADAVLRVARDDVFARRLSRKGRELAESNFGWNAIAGRLLDAYREILPPSDRPKPRELPKPASSPAEDPPAVSIVIPTRCAGRLFERCLEAIEGQEQAPPHEVICVDRGTPAAVLDRLAERRVRVVVVPSENREADDPGRSANQGASAARGRVLVFLDQDAVPQSSDWLKHLTAPLFAERAPVAVCGAVAERIAAPESPRASFRRLPERFKDEWKGIELSLVNAAIRREIWEEYPFQEGLLLADRRWQRQMIASGFLILPIYAASVTYGSCGPVGPHDRWKEGVREGAAWRDLGISYRFPEIASDLSTCVRTLRAHPRGLLFTAVWLIGLFAGNLTRFSKT